MRGNKNRTEAQNTQIEFKRFLRLLERKKINWPFHNKCVRYVILSTYTHTRNWGFIRDAIIVTLGGMVRMHTWKEECCVDLARLRRKIVVVTAGEALAVAQKHLKISWEEMHNFFRIVNEGANLVYYMTPGEEKYASLDIYATISEHARSRFNGA